MPSMFFKGEFMKKHARSLSPFVALFVLAAITPQTSWSNECDLKNRKPASDELNCLKEEKDKLEKDVKKLVEDKQKVLLELEDLKSKNSKDSEDKLEGKENKKEKKEVVSHDSMDIIYQMTSLMMSQQQQQQMMMNQMFSLMNMQMQNFAFSNPVAKPLSAHMSPYAFDYGTLQASFNPYSLESLGQGFGVGMSHASYSVNPYRLDDHYMVKTPYRYPAEQPMQLERNEIPFQPRIEGFNFGGTPADVPPVPLDAKPPVQMEKKGMLRT